MQRSSKQTYTIRLGVFDMPIHDNYSHVRKDTKVHFLFLIAAFVFVYSDTIISLVHTWSGRDDYSHGFIVPFASLYFVYTMRSRLKEIPVVHNLPLGSAITVAGTLLLILGKVGGIISVQQLSIIVVIPGIVISLYGTEMFKALLLPLGYLVLMVPLILDVVLDPLHWPFQLFGARLAAIILAALNVPVYHNAQFVQLPNISLEVANVCSGIRYLVSILALSIPLAYLLLQTWQSRILLLATSIMIGILANPIRVALIGLWVHHGGNMVHGPGHMLQGYSVSIVGFAFLFLSTFILRRWQKERSETS